MARQGLPVNVSEIVEFLYRNCADLSPEMETRFGLHLRERITDLKQSDFGATHSTQIDQLSQLLDQYATTQERPNQEICKTKINSIILKLLRADKKIRGY